MEPLKSTLQIIPPIKLVWPVLPPYASGITNKMHKVYNFMRMSTQGATVSGRPVMGVQGVANVLSAGAGDLWGCISEGVPVAGALSKPSIVGTAVGILVGGAVGIYLSNVPVLPSPDPAKGAPGG